MELEELIKRLDRSRMPKHVAIIMDGNGRWARKRFMNRVKGHTVGVEVAKKIVELSRRINLPVLSLFAFSMENWRRPKSEIKVLMGLLESYLKNELRNLMEQDIRLHISGDISMLPERTRKVVEEVTEATKGNRSMILNLAVSYSGRWDIVQAVKRIAEDVKSGIIDVNDINEVLFKSYLSTAQLPPPDLLIRTSGEMRISNFFLWDLAYTELYFTPTLWPEFTEEEFIEAILDYQRRERRFGMTTEQVKEVDVSKLVH